MAYGNGDGTPAWEQAIATNPAALSPLLLKRTGLLTVEIAAWCAQGCALINALAEELKVVRPNVFDRRRCDAELIGAHLDAVLTLGLSSRAPGGELQARAFMADFHDLLQSLVDDFIDLVHQQIELHVSSYVLRVEREEPDGCSEVFDTLKARRDAEARAIARIELQKLGPSGAAGTSSKLEAPFLRDWLLQVIVASIESPPADKLETAQIPEESLEAIRQALGQPIRTFDDFRKHAVAGVAPLKHFVDSQVPVAQSILDAAQAQKVRAKAEANDAAYQAAVNMHEALLAGQSSFDPTIDDAKVQEARTKSEAADAACAAAVVAYQALLDAQTGFEATIPELVDRTLVLLRVEVLEDVLEANYPPSVRTSPFRADRVARALDDLKETLRKLSGDPPLTELVTAYCHGMFKEKRGMVLSTLLTESRGADQRSHTGRTSAAPRRAASPGRLGKKDALRRDSFPLAKQTLERRAQAVTRKKATEAVENIAEGLHRIAQALEKRGVGGRAQQPPPAPGPDGEPK